MNCPNIEEIIRFASQIPSEVDANLAAHIYSCKVCQANLIMAIDVLRCNYKVTNTDIDYANDIIRKTTQLYILSDIVSFISEQLQKTSLLSLSSLKIPHLPYNVISSFASAGKAKIHGHKKSPEIPFVSSEAKSSPHYWKVLLQFPIILHESSTIQLFAVDANSKPIENAVMILGGIAIQISNGEGEISFNDFKKSTNGHEIVLKFPDKYTSPGVIELQ